MFGVFAFGQPYFAQARLFYVVTAGVVRAQIVWF